MTAANLETRRLAADTYKTTLLQLANIAKDSYAPGENNLLAGQTMRVNLNEDEGDVVQNVQIGGAVDPLSLGFTGFSLTAGTGADSTTANNFNNDPEITAAITRVNAAITTLRSRQNALSNHNSMLSTRLDYNKTYQGITQELATSITAADTAEESVKKAALQIRQDFVITGLAAAKQAEQSLIQILR